MSYNNQKKIYKINVDSFMPNEDVWIKNNELYVRSEETEIAEKLQILVDSLDKDSGNLTEEDTENYLNEEREKYRKKYITEISEIPKIQGGGNKKHKPKICEKKIIQGRERCIYNIPGSKKKYVKYKGEFITLKDFVKKAKRG